MRSEDTADAAAHILVATRLRNGRERPIYTFSGRIEALWSPDSRYVAITDYSFGEGDADLYVADLDASALVNAEQEMHRTMKSAPPTRLNGRRLFHALEWQSPTSLRFEARTFGSASDQDGRVVLTFDIRHRQVR